MYPSVPITDVQALSFVAIAQVRYHVHARDSCKCDLRLHDEKTEDRLI